MTGERVERRLTAVLAADVAGYSRLMGADEVGTLEALKAIRREVVDPAVSAYRGRIVKTTGDGMLVEFASAVDAVTCAMAVQDKMTARNLNAATDGSTFDRGSMSATSSSTEAISSAMASMSPRDWKVWPIPAVFVFPAPRAAYDQVRDKVDFEFVDLGERPLKNIARPVGSIPAWANAAGNGAPAWLQRL